MIIVNGKLAVGWRLDELDAEGPSGMDFLMNPFAIVPKKENADRIVKAFELLGEWKRTPFFENREAWQNWVAEFGARVDLALGKKEE